MAARKGEQLARRCCAWRHCARERRGQCDAGWSQSHAGSVGAWAASLRRRCGEDGGDTQHRTRTWIQAAALGECGAWRRRAHRSGGGRKARRAGRWWARKEKRAGPIGEEMDARARRTSGPPLHPFTARETDSASAGRIEFGEKINFTAEF